ncbi:unnamed protein product, partial [Oikopleura dioica]
YGILMSSKKVKFCRAEFDFLGHKINSAGISATNKHIEAIKNFPVPKDRTSLKQFLGLANFNLKFKKIPFEWTDVHQTAFEEIVEQLATSPRIAHFDKEKPVALVNDASGHAVGGTLYQENGSDLVPIGDFSRELSGQDLRRSMRQKELLAVAYASSTLSIIFTIYEPRQNTSQKVRELDSLREEVVENSESALFVPTFKNKQIRPLNCCPCCPC